jgi:hypothetical protein
MQLKLKRIYISFIKQKSKKLYKVVKSTSILGDSCSITLYFIL